MACCPERDKCRLRTLLSSAGGPGCELVAASRPGTEVTRCRQLVSVPRIVSAHGQKLGRGIRVSPAWDSVDRPSEIPCRPPLLSFLSPPPPPSAEPITTSRWHWRRTVAGMRSGL